MDKKDEKQQYEDSIRDDLRYLELLSHSYPTIADASTEIINLEAILNLPKPTEHFISDPHGESDAFNHVLRNASGYVKRKVNELFGDQLDESDKRELCTLIYYPEQKLQLLKLEKRDMHDFYRTSLVRLISVCREVSSKYTRSKIRKELPKDFEYIIEELLHESYSGYGEKKHKYYQMIVESIIDTGRADAFITEISKLIQRLAIDRLHLLGDIYDRGPGADKIMDTLCDYKHFDIVWGNHDIEWMGACAGNRACICNVLRLCMRYGNLSTLEDGYGINLLPLATFAMDTYRDDPCTEFEVRDLLKDGSLDEQTMRMLTQMHKAITIIQLKEEARIIDRRPSFGMTDRKLLDAIDLETGTVQIGNKTYTLKDSHFPTLMADNPSKLTKEEERLMTKIEHSFRASEKLRRHIDCLLSRGGMYRVCNSNLMFHGSVPLDKDGQLKEVEVEGKQYKGKELMRKIERVVRNAFNSEVSSDRRRFSVDYLWYLWCGKDSPLFDKDKMATFERYFVADSKTYKEKKGYYYEYNNDEATIDMILDDFEVEGTHRHIINGHVPVKTTRGETPVKANGKLLVIDGGFSKAYQPETGIAGYTLIFHSQGLELMQHQPFRSAEEAVKRGDDIKSSVQIVEMSEHRMYVKDTDKGKVLQSKVENLKKLLYAYRNGLLN
jgi:fructose-1,6-bisphosphatase-3